MTNIRRKIICQRFFFRLSTEYYKNHKLPRSESTYYSTQNIRHNFCHWQMREGFDAKAKGC